MTRAALVLFVLLGMTASAQDMLPKNGAVAGWTRKDPPRTFVSTQLWEYMDGGADVYLDHGFRKVHTVEMTREKKDVLIDVFEFGSVDQAFGMYAQERPATPSPVAVGTEGYAQGNTLAFYHGKYYVKLTAYANDADTKMAVKNLAAATSRGIRDPKTPPRALALLPKTGRLPHTEKRIPTSFLGSLRGAFTAEYRVKGQNLTLFLVPFASAPAAATALRGLRPTLSRPGTFDKGAVLAKPTAFLTGAHPKAGPIIILQQGSWLLGAYPVKNAEQTGHLLSNVKP